MACTLNKKDNRGSDFSNCDFSNKDLSGYNFSGCILHGTNFSGCTFDANTNFTNASFGASNEKKATDFSSCDLSKAIFSQPANFGYYGSRETRTNLSFATVPWKLFSATLSYLDLSKSVILDMPQTIEFLTLNSVTWHELDLSHRVLDNAHFTDCDLTDANMEGAILDYSSFLGGTNLTNANLSRCSLLNVVFTGSTMTRTNLSFATQFSNCTFENTLLKGTIFDGNDLRNSNFSQPPRLSTNPNYITSFQFSTLEASFFYHTLDKNWQCLDLRNVNIPDFNTIIGELENLQAQNSFFNNTLDFTGAFLNGSNFQNAKFNAVNFTGAHLNNCTFDNAATVQGSVGGPSYAIFRISTLDTILPAGIKYSEFRDALNSSAANNKDAISNNKIIKIFAHFNYTIGDIETQLKTDVFTQDEKWKITDTSVVPNRVFRVLQKPISTKDSEMELLVFNDSPCKFSRAQLIGSTMQSINFSNSIMNNSQLYGSFLTYANLTLVDMSGAQLGKNSAIFSISDSDSTISPPYNYDSFINDLNGPIFPNIINVFKKNGYNINPTSVNPITQSTEKVNLSWSITDESTSPERLFTVFLTAVNNTSNELAVFYDGGAPAVLDYAYMPGINLKEAMLTGCSAEGCYLIQSNFLGVSANLVNATLIDVSFVNANLYEADFTNSIINGINFTGANLMNANFCGVTIENSTSGNVVNFENSNLQGVNFTGAAINNANFLNAAFCLPLSKNNSTETNGVWLSNISNTDNNFEDILNELNLSHDKKSITNPSPSNLLLNFLKEGTIKPDLLGVLNQNEVALSNTSILTIQKYSSTWKINDVSTSSTYDLFEALDDLGKLTYVVFEEGKNVSICNLSQTTSLKAGQVPASLIATLKTNSEGEISLSNQSTLIQYQRPVVWNIEDIKDSKSYTLWWSAEYIAGLSNLSHIRPAIPNLIQYFKESLAIDLRLQSQTSIVIDTKTDTTTWTIDMGFDDPFYFQTGYIKFRVVGNSATSPTSLSIFGFSLRMSGINKDHKQTMVNVSLDPTSIDASSINDKTLLPNNKTKLQNVNAKVPFPEWLHILNIVPAPPICVPGALTYCQAPIKS